MSLCRGFFLITDICTALLRWNRRERKMGIRHEIAQYRAYRKGVVHTTLNPEGPGAVRIHLIPPKWRPFSDAPYVMILNGYYILPLGYSWAILLGNFIREVNAFSGRSMGENDVQRCIHRAAVRTQGVYTVSGETLRSDLEGMLAMFYEVAKGKEPAGDFGALSLREYAPNMTAPHRMDLMISSMAGKEGNWNCSLKCRHCYAAGQPEAMTGELSVQEWKRVIDSCKKAGICQITFTGGEPTMREDLPELVDYARWFVTRLNTNGVRLTADLCEKLYAASLDSVQITLYSEDACIHNQLVGADLPGTEGNWEKTVAGLRNALAAGLNVSVNTPLCRDNANYIGLLHFLHQEGVEYVTCSGLIETGKASSKGSVSAQISLGEMDELLENAQSFCIEHGMELSFTSPGRATAETLRRLGIAVPMCGACLSNMAVAPNGSVVPCQSWLEAGAVLGNMLTDDWKKIWDSDLCRSIRGMTDAESLLCPLRTQNGRRGTDDGEEAENESEKAVVGIE